MGTRLENVIKFAKMWIPQNLTNKRYPISAQYTLENQPIKEVTFAKYLGVTIDKNLSWSEYILNK